jgi:hypothetical protein
MPINQSATNVTVDIGDGSFNSKPQDYIHALGHYSDCYNLSERELSVAPCFMDRTASYEVTPVPNTTNIDVLNLPGRSPFSSYSENPYVVPRSGYNGGLKLNGTTLLDPALTIPQAFTVVLTVCEPLFVSPLTYGDEVRGLTNFTNCSVTVALSNQLSKVFSSKTAATILTEIKVPDVTFGNATLSFVSVGALGTNIGPQTNGATKLYCSYVTSKMNIPQVLHYQHNPITSYKKSNITLSGLGFEATSDSVQLSSVPKRLYVFVEPSVTNPNTPNTFAAISKMQLFFANGPSMLSQADQKQLYLMSERNGCQLSWTEWSNPSLSGSVLCVDFARDCGMEMDWFVGRGGPVTCYFQCNGTVAATAPVTYNMWAIYVFDGYITITRGGSVVSYNSVFSANQSEVELFEADFMPWVKNPDAMYYGGASLREIGSKIVNVVKGKVIPSARWIASQIMKHPDQAKAIADTVLGIIPYGAELENFIKTVLAFIPDELKDRAASALRGSGKMLEQGPAGGTFTGGAVAKSGIRKTSMMDLYRK